MTLSVMQVLHQGGGAGSVTSTLVLSLGLAEAGLHVRFVCPPNSEVEALARSGGLEVHPLLLEPGRTGTNAARLAQLLNRHPVSLVNSQSARDRKALTRLALSRRLKVPFVATRRQMPRTFFLTNWLTSHLAARMVAVSKAVGAALVRRGTPRHKLVIIPNGLVTARVDVPISDQALRTWRERIAWSSSLRTIGIVARQKDQEVVLQALNHLELPVRLVLAGVDPGGALGKRARAAPARHQVVCVPFDLDVRPLYELLELVLLPSRSEGLSQSLLEAMALGKPVIASRAAGNVEVVTHGIDGLLVNPLDPLAWANAIEHLLTHPETAATIGGAARSTARDRFSLSHTVERTIALYQAVVGR
jgi:glycosyltransferase involved in cell wall biosynthesis